MEKDVRAFLGYSVRKFTPQFVPQLATITAPLTDLMKKAAPTQVVWNSDQEKVCIHNPENINQFIRVLKSPDQQQRFILQTDASDMRIGAVLSRVGDDGDEDPVAFYHRKLLPQETRGESLTIYNGVQNFLVYLL